MMLSTLTQTSASTPPRRRHCDRCTSSLAASSAGPVTGVERTTLVISPDTGHGQRLLHIYPKVKPEGHAEEVLALLQKS